MPQKAKGISGAQETVSKQVRVSWAGPGLDSLLTSKSNKANVNHTYMIKPLKIIPIFQRGK